MNKLFYDLEFNKILDEIKTYCASSLSADQLDHIKMYKDIDDLKDDCNKTLEAMHLIDTLGRLPLGGLKNIYQYIEIADKNGTLEPLMLLDVYNHLSCVDNVKKYMNAYEGNSHYINQLVGDLEYNESLKLDIERCISEDGSILDHASDKLYTLRKQIKSISEHIHSTIEQLSSNNTDIMSYDSFTTRNDRFVLPVKSNYKSKVNGIVHAYSKTGGTIYIEPEAIVQLNNELESLKVDEIEEINQILFKLSQHVKQYYHHIKFNLEILTELDYIFSKAYYGYMHHCTIGEIGNELNIFEARHPLIDEDKVISNDILFDNKRMMIITGSNTGGKTVTLKTVGLLSLMTLCAIPVTCRSLTIPFFNKIYVDLIDEQSIEQSLSTFSSHMSKVIKIMNICDENSLVILDEIGSGTDPVEGESIALTLLEKLIYKKSYTITSTHYSHIKNFAVENDQVISASVSFDKENMKPTYHLYLNQTGESYAFEIASNLGLKHSDILRAKEIKDSFTSENEKLLEELSKKETLLNQKEESLNLQASEINQLKNTYETKIKSLDKQKEKIISDAHNKANAYIEDTKKEIDHIIEDMKNKGFKQHIVNNAKNNIDALKYKDEDHYIQDHILKVGDHVLITSMNKEADIIEIAKNHSIVVDLGGLPIKLSENDVRYLHDKTKIKPVESVKKQTINKKGSYELNIIGERYEDAMNIVSKFLDDALVLGYPSVRIIHGMGTGALRNGVRKQLERNKHVDNYRDGGPTEGGLGATLVYFK